MCSTCKNIRFDAQTFSRDTDDKEADMPPAALSYHIVPELMKWLKWDELKRMQEVSDAR